MMLPLMFLPYYDFVFRKNVATTLNCEQRAGRTHRHSVAATACMVTVTFPTRDSFASFNTSIDTDTSLMEGMGSVLTDVTQSFAIY